MPTLLHCPSSRLYQHDFSIIVTDTERNAFSTARQTDCVIAENTTLNHYGSHNTQGVTQPLFGITFMHLTDAVVQRDSVHKLYNFYQYTCSLETEPMTLVLYGPCCTS